MYSLVSAIAKPILDQGRWRSVDISNVSMLDLYSLYDRVLVTLSNPFLPANVCLDLKNLRAQYGTQSITFAQLLVANGNATLPTTQKLPLIKTRYAQYRDGVKAGFKIQPVHPTASPGTPMPPEDRTWLLLTKRNTDYVRAYKSFLITVNGFVHATDASPDGLYVQNGMVSKFMSGKAELGICNLQQLGSMSFVPITDDMIYKQISSQPFKERVYIDLGQNVSDKTVMLVLGGYLHILDQNTFRRVSDTAFAIDWQNLSYLDRYYESKDYIDLSSLQLEVSDLNPNQVSIPELFSDEVIRRYLKLSQSFFVILDNQEVFLEKYQIQTRKGPGMYTSYIMPDFPLMGELGKMVTYWPTKEQGQWAINCSDAFRKRRQYQSTNFKDLDSVSGELEPSDRKRNGNLYFWKFGSDVIL